MFRYYTYCITVLMVTYCITVLMVKGRFIVFYLILLRFPPRRNVNLPFQLKTTLLFPR